MQFKVWLESQNISIDYNHFNDSLNKLVKKYIDDLKEKKYQVSIFNPEEFINNLQKTFPNYPLLKNFINSLNYKNKNYIFDQYKKLYNWMSNQKYNLNYRELLKKTWTYLDYLEPQNYEEKEIYNQIKIIEIKTQKEMFKIQNIVEEAIYRMTNWNSSVVKIAANPAEDIHGPILEESDSAYITVGVGEMAPYFLFFQVDGKIEIDDVIEGGDTDFFETPQIQADYFNLINEIKHPNSTNKGKILTLYTARPAKDRNQLLNSKILPINIFLTNDYNHAEGLAIDLGRKRDVWKIKIDSKYLIQTLDGLVKYYQVTSNNAETKSMDLISSSDHVS